MYYTNALKLLKKGTYDDLPIPDGYTIHYSIITRNYLTYALNRSDNTAELIECNTNGEVIQDMVIPETVNYNDIQFTVTSMAKQSFTSESKIVSLTIPGTVKNVVWHTMVENTTIKKLTFSEGVEQIAGTAFYNTKVTEVYLPLSLTKISWSSFGHGSDEILTSKKWYYDGSQNEILTMLGKTDDYGTAYYVTIDCSDGTVINGKASVS